MDDEARAHGLGPDAVSVPAGTAAFSADGERNIVFTSLVREDGDITGLVAYSIYKQNKLDWLQAFEKLRSRAPDEAEQLAYIVGESTPRRLAIYRHLADATLAGGGPVAGATAADGSARRMPLKRQSERLMQSIVPSVIVGAIVLVGVWLILHFDVRP